MSLIFINEIWFSYGLPIPYYLNHKANLQIIAVFLMMFVLAYYTYVCFVKPPIYNDKNYKFFARVVPDAIAFGSDDYLKAIAIEIRYSLSNIIEYALKAKKESHDKHKNKFGVNEFAHDFFYIIDEERFIALLVSSAQGTIRTLFQHIRLYKAHDLYYAGLIKNIFRESIRNKNSFLYREDEYGSGMYSIQKPISSEIFKNTDLIISQSLFKISHTDYQRWDIQQLKCYLIALKTFILELSKKRNIESYSPKNNNNELQEVYHAFEVLSHYIRYQDFDKRENISNDYLYTIMNFISDIMQEIKIINKNNGMQLRPKPCFTYKIEEIYEHRNNDIYSYISWLIYEIVKDTAMKISDIKYNQDYYWIAFNIIWSSFIRYDINQVHRVVFYKLRRRLYQEIKEAEVFPNYSNMKILGFCLNLPKAINNRALDYRFLHAVQLWTRKHYFKIRNDNIDVANVAIVGRLSYDEDKNAIVTTFSKLLNKEPHKEYLYLKT